MHSTANGGLPFVAVFANPPNLFVTAAYNVVGGEWCVLERVPILGDVWAYPSQAIVVAQKSVAAKWA